MDHAALRPIERRVLRLDADGIDHTEIARRFQRSPEFIERLMDLARLPGRSGSTDDAFLRPLERRILAWRADGAAPADIAPRFRRSPGFVERVEQLAHYKLSLR